MSNFEICSVGINIDVKQRTIDDAHSLRDVSAQKMRTDTKQGRNTHQSHNSQKVSPRGTDPRKNDTAGSELHKGFIGKQIGRVRGEFDNFDNNTNQPSDLFDHSVPKKFRNQKSYMYNSRSPDRLDSSQQPVVTLKKLNNLGQLHQPREVKLIKNVDWGSKEQLRIANQSAGRPDNSGYSGDPIYGSGYYGKNNDLANVTNDPRRKSFSPGYSRISKGTTPNRNTTSQKRGTKASPATRQGQSKSGNFRGSSGKTRSNFNKNAQIQNKFNQNDKEYPIMDYGESQTQKALVKKMKELSASRVKPQPVKATKAKISLKKKKAPAKKVSPTRNQSNGPDPRNQYNLQQEYNQRRERMDSKLSDEVFRSSIIPQQIVFTKHVPKNFEKDRRDQSEGHVSQSSIDDQLDMIPGHEDSPQILKPNQERLDYYRSKRQINNVIQNNFVQDVNSLDYDKTELIQEINDRLIELDQLNEQKKALSHQLINSIKFVRDLQSSLGTADNGHITEVVDMELKERFEQEKQENQRLKELKKANEKEREEIIYQLGILNGQHDVTVVDRQGKEINLRKAAMGVEDMMKYRQTVAYQIETVSKDLASMQAEEDNLARHIMNLQPDYDRMAEDRNQIGERVRDIQHQYDTTFKNNEAHIREMAYEFRSSKTHYSGKVLSSTLANVFRLRLSAHFQQVRHQNKCDEKTIAAILAFRKVCYNYDDKRQKMYLQKWFHNALKPAQMLVQNRNVVDFINKNEKMKKILIRWHHAQLQAYTQNSYDSQKVHNASKAFHDCYLRQYRHAFNVWKNAHGSKTDAHKKISWFVREQMNGQRRQAILLWKNYVETQNFNMRMQAEAVRFTVCQFKSGLFYAWRQQTTILKRQRIGLTIRTFKILNRHRMTCQHIRRKFTFIMKHNDKKADHDLKSVFQALKLNKEQEKHQKVHSRLHDEELVMIANTKDHIDAVQARTDRKTAVRAIQKGVLNPFKGLMKSYFDKWNGTHQYIKQTMNGKIKDRIIKVYNSRLREAWDKWHIVQNKKRRRKKMQMHSEMESNNVAMQDEIQKTRAAVQDQEVRSVNTGHAKIKKMIYKAYCAELKDALDRWKGRITHEEKTGEKLSNGVLRKWQKRLWNDAFQKWKANHVAVKREEKQESRTDDTVIKFQNRQIKRMWDVLEANAHIKVKARKKFGKILGSEYNRFQKVYFERWKDHKEEHKKAVLHKKQMMHTEEMQQTINLKAEHEDLLHSQQQKHADLVKSSQSMAQKNMRKFITQWKNYNLYEAFTRWKAAQDTHKETKSKIQNTIFKRMYNNMTRDAFATWRRNLKINHHNKKKFSMNIESENHQVQEDKLEVTRTKIAQTRERSAHMVKSLRGDQDKSKAMHANQVELMTKHVMNNFVVTKREQIFAAWRDIAHSKAVKMKKLVALIHKNQLQHGIDTLSVVHHSTARQNEHDKKMLKFLNGWGASLKRDAIHIWKQRCFEAVKKQHQEVQEAHFHSSNNSNINRQKEIDDQAPKYLLKSQQYLMKKIFEILFDYRSKQKQKTQAHDEVDDKFGFLRKRYQFQKWRLRADQTIIYRQKQKILMRNWHLSRKRNLFNAFRAHHQKHNNLQRLLSHMHHNVTQENLRYAWRHIESKAHMNRQTTDRKFKDNQILIHNLSMKLWHRSLKRRFDQLLANSRASHGKNANLNSIMHKAINRFSRDFFNKWKKNADMLEVIRFNNEEGPVRIEVHHKKAEILALKEMIKDKQLLDDQAINELLDENEDKYKTAINQSLARLNLHGQGKNKENDHWIKPYCLDKWKLWLQERKSYKHALNLCDMHIKGGDLLDISQAFRKWKRIALNRHDHLHAQTQENLMDRDHKNNLELVDVKNQLEDAHHEIGDMKNQREYLIEKVVIGQRLALARCRDSFRHVLHKAFARWHHFKHSHVQAQFHGHLTGNKDTLGAHKQRLEDVHEENVNIADQNHELHQGAKEGVAELDKVEGLHADVTHLNEKIVAQAAQLQKLLAQNKQLKKQVAEHEGKH